MTYTLLLFLAALLIGTLYLTTSRKRSRFAGLTWEELVDKLQPVSMDGVSKVALDYLQPIKGQLAIETHELWLLVGEVEGLKRMQQNADVLIALAAFAQQWNFHESVIVRERMRRDGLALRRAVWRVKLGLSVGYRKVYGPFSLQEAASSYYLMQRRLLALYETSHVGRYPRLAAAM